jgi:hypothetical protein
MKMGLRPFASVHPTRDSEATETNNLNKRVVTPPRDKNVDFAAQSPWQGGRRGPSGRLRFSPSLGRQFPGSLLASNARNQ